MVISRKSVIKIDVKKSELKSFKVLKKQHSSNISILTEEKKKLQNKYKTLKLQVVSKENEYDKVISKLSDIQDKVDTLIEKKKNIEIALTKYGNITPETIEDNFNKNKNLLEQIKNKKIKLDKNIQKINTTNKDIVSETVKLDAIKNETISLNSILDSLKEKESILIVDIDTFKHKIHNLKTTEDLKIQALENTNKELKEKTKEAEELVDQINKSKERLKHTNIKLKLSKDKLEKYNAKEQIYVNIDKDIFEKEKKLNILVEKVNKTTQTIEKNKELRIEQAKLEHNISNTKKRLKSTADILSNTTTKLQSVEAEIKLELDNLSKLKMLVLKTKEELENLKLEIKKKTEESDIISRKSKNDMNLLKAKKNEVSRLIMLSKKHLKKRQNRYNIKKEANE